MVSNLGLPTLANRITLGSQDGMNAKEAALAKELKVGELVQLRSGGPTMTVSDTELYGEPDQVECQWFGGRKLERGRFPVASLVEPKEEEK